MKNVIKCLNQLSHRGTGTLTILGIMFFFNRTLILFIEMIVANQAMLHYIFIYNLQFDLQFF